MTTLSRRTLGTGLALASMHAAARRSPWAAARQATPVLDIPVPIEFPRDDGVHDTSIEWWYFTGNLQTEVSERLGFEYVIFRARPGDLAGPFAWRCQVCPSVIAQMGGVTYIPGASWPDGRCRGRPRWRKVRAP